MKALVAATLAAILVSLLGPARARAQLIMSDSNSDRGHQSSPQHFALEVRLGPYRPDIDSEFAGTSRTPYANFFGSSRRLMMQLEFDYQIIRHVGSLGIGLTAGYFKETGNNVDQAGDTTKDTSSLRLLPFAVSAVYRFDLGYKRLGIPLVPYTKLGLDYVLWTIENGNGEVPEDASGGRGAGGTLGWHTAVGLSLILDVFDRDGAKQFDEETGINHTYVFFEFGHVSVNGLGQSNGLHVGDDTWTAGMMFEF